MKAVYLLAAITINKQNRLAAYKKYFGTRPTDYGSHDFERWSQVSRYLWKRFYDLLSEEKI